MNNVVGKMLVVLTLVFCLLLLCFAGAVYSYSGQWRTKAADLQARLTGADDNIKKISDDRNAKVSKLEAEIAELTLERDQFSATLAAKQQDDGNTQQLLADALQAADKSATDAQIASDEQAARIAEAAVLNAEVQKQADRISKLFAELQQLEDSELNLERQLASAEEKEEQQLSENARLKDLLRANEIDPRQAIAGILPEEKIEVDGFVERTLKAQNRELIEITIGSDDKIYKDSFVTVYRGRKYVCKARVVRVEPDLAICMVDEDTRREQIRKGDRVTTKF
ncbi:MAG: hypothetical protein ABJZ55_02780 [Fuerstiella sp.]